MKNIKIKTNKKQAFASIVFALILTFCFNFTPISILSNRISKWVEAYQSKSTQTYYGNSDITTETNIGEGKYPSSLAKYFEGSSQNFNIQVYYQNRFSDIFAEKVNKFLAEARFSLPGEESDLDPNDPKSYNSLLKTYLEKLGGYESLSHYYNTNKNGSLSSYETFRTFFEDFVSEEHTYEIVGSQGEENQQIVVPALFSKSRLIYNFYQSYIYNALAYFLDPEHTDSSISDNDGLTEDTENFYEASTSYGRVKKNIDDEIVATVAIYSYDNETQNNYVAGIVANGAPTSTYYYYKDGDDAYDQIYLPQVNVDEYSGYVGKNFTDPASGSQSWHRYYYIEEDITTFKSQLNPTEQASFNDIEAYVQDNLSLSTLQSNPLLYRPLVEGEEGYIGPQHPVYVQFSSFRYETEYNIQKIYIVDGNPDETRSATYNSLQYVTTISREELEADQYIDGKLNKDRLYIQVPYLPSANSKGGIWFDTLFGYIKDSGYYENLINNVLTEQESGQETRTSRVYLKLTQVSRKVIYVDKELSGYTVEEFRDKFPDYANRYTIKKMDLKTHVLDDYYEVESSRFSGYTSGINGTKIYFLKLIEYYTELDEENSYEKDETGSLKYEMERVPDIEFAMHNVPTDKFVKDDVHTTENKIFVLGVTKDLTDNRLPLTINEDPSYSAYKISESEFNEVRNRYVPVPESISKNYVYDGEEGVTYSFYYCHELKSQREIYIVVDNDGFDSAKNNDVYKNLYYNVISEDDYKNTYYNYVVLENEDENYNENFKLYYKYNYDLTPPEDNSPNEKLEDLFVKNQITGFNAIYVVDELATSYDKSEYKAQYLTVINEAQFNEEKEFYVQLNEQWLKFNGLSTDLGYNLYFKYKNATTRKKVYEYTSNTNSSYSRFYSTDSDYRASDYELIDSSSDDYVSGASLYYKKIRNDKYLEKEVYKDTYYYYQANSNVSLRANSFYAISFYLYTNGNLYEDTDKVLQDEGNDVPVFASLYFTDTSGSIKDIELENLSTNGTWKKYYVFVATDSILSSTIQMKLYMGDKNNIAGKYKEQAKSVKGVVLFDDINIITINETDYNKHFIDDTSIYTYKAPETEGTEEEDPPSEPAELPFDGKADLYGNEVIVIDYADNRIRNNSVVNNWNEQFDFDRLEESFLKTEEGVDTPTSVQKELFSKYFEENPNSILYEYDDEELWHYFISRSDSGLGNKDKFELIKNAYLNGKVEVDVVDEESFYDDKVKAKEKEDEEKKKNEETTDDSNSSSSDEDDDDSNDVPFIKSTFGLSNKVLRISNSDTQNSLGVVSKPFTIKQGEYYKITIWIYSTDKDATATLTAETILKTKNTSEVGKYLSSSASKVNAHLSDYATTPVNEYGWIPISFYIEGNAYRNQDMYLVLRADAKQTVYFDNISIEKITSAAFTTASTDSDVTTYTLQLSESTSLVSTGITNGDFASINVTDNYKENGDDLTVDYTKPRTAKNWTIVSGNSEKVVAGVIPTSNEYLSHAENFYSKYNDSKYPFVPYDEHNLDTLRYPNNIYAIYAPSEVAAGIKDADESKTYSVKNNYKIYSSSTSISSNTTYEISFDFIPGKDFNGNMVARIYAGSYDPSRILASFSVNYSETEPATEWETYTFIVENGITSSSIYLEIGIEDATGTCFFQKARSVTSSYNSINEARDALLAADENNEETSDGADIFNKTSLSHYKFSDLKNSTLSVHSSEKNENGTYDSGDYKSSLSNKSDYTVGKSGVAVASFYTKTESTDYFTVTIDEKTYYVKGEETEANGETKVVYKLYSDSVYKNEVTDIGGKDIEIEFKNDKLKVLVGKSKTEYAATEVLKTDYSYKFTDDIVLGDNFISASELNNNISGNVLILSNSYTTDYNSLSPVFTKSLSTSTYFALKIYVKTSNITPKDPEKESGLNIIINSISTSWTNIDTTKLENVSEENNGFVCYQVLIQTNTSSVSSFGVQFSLGSETNPCSGYALIAGVTLQSFANETLFNEYASTLDENDQTIKRFYGTTSSSDEEPEEEEETDATSTWATFFYIFSSLLLGVVIIIALVALILKKHPIKIGKKSTSSENIIITSGSKTSQTRKERKKDDDSDILTETTNENTETPSNDDLNTDGFV